MSEAWPSWTVRVEAPEGVVYVRLAYQDGHPRHIGIQCGKSGGIAAGFASLLGRWGSKALRPCPKCGYHVTVSSLVRSARGITHDRSGNHEAASMPDAIGRALEMIEKLRTEPQKIA